MCYRLLTGVLLQQGYWSVVWTSGMVVGLMGGKEASLSSFSVDCTVYGGKTEPV